MDNKLSELSKPVMYSLRFRNMHTGEPDKNINANTTFSTLEKAKAYGLGSRYVTQDDGKIVSVRDPAQDPIVEPLYSQEYVSALLEEIGVRERSLISNCVDYEYDLIEMKRRAEAAEQKLAANNSEWFQLFPMASPRVVAVMNVDLQNALAKRDQRIAELERANTSQDDHINQQQDRIDSLEKTNAGLGRRLGDAEKRLATPVRMPTKYSLKMAGDKSTRAMFSGHNSAINDSADAIRAAGFKVEGDEQ
ncbi:hypothetical protein [Serratia marcescens]|uniref:hypothetical protein n=1 Tax=Serratia marcescens TaxID=615 RepID=UPI0028819764|nr:hypothetical protein [Serratia marcescens]MDT0208069.1 hypothetical protein [Serratia marcescens]